ncbi:hypothetical protein T11_16521 [Trichinella zimbabwensis]|uniref:Uncharacterized protein n=1 Tax=Trichinella zimbabwensis TaxID=268475 RepID=A0A0V1GPC3_9BILA|nr:hypothetical protein T11_16521 [Trichinella zimbabwensis]
MEEELVWTKRHYGKQIVGEFLGIKRHVAEICVQSCLRESRTRYDQNSSGAYFLCRKRHLAEKKA